MNASFSYLLPDQQINSISVKDEDIVSYQNGKKKRKVFQNCQYDQTQISQIQQFRKYATPLHEISQVQDATILRYLYSFDFKHPQALQKLKIYLDWYSDPKIQRLDQKTLQLINSGVCYTYGRDRQLRPIIYLNVALIDMEKYTLEDYLSATNAIITLVIQKLFIKGKIQNYLFIIDTDNKNFSSLPLTVVKEMTLKLSYVFSMRMGKLLIINCNYLVKMMYSAVSPFLADVTKLKINLLSKSEVEEGKMKEYIDINELQQKYGGFRQNLTEKWPPQIPGKELPQKIKKKQKNHHELREQSFYQSKIVTKLQVLEQFKEDDYGSEYYSCENNSEMFYKIDQKMTVNQGCCAAQQCNIY